MRKFLVSVAVGVLLSIGSVSAFAACADVVTFGDRLCQLTSSGTSPNGTSICYYSCVKITAPAPVNPGES